MLIQKEVGWCRSRNGIQNILRDFKGKLSEDFRIHVIREDHETLIKIIYREEIKF